MFPDFSPAGDLPVHAVSPLSSREHKTMGLDKEDKDSRCATVGSQRRQLLHAVTTSCTSRRQKKPNMMIDVHACASYMYNLE